MNWGNSMNEGTIILAQNTENTISTSRTFHEQLNIEGGTTGYGVLAALIDSNMSRIDAVAENLGKYIAQNVVKDKYDQQYFNNKFGRFKNFWTRNIYLDPQKKQAMEEDRAKAAFVASLGTEVTIKLVARAAQSWMQHCDKIAVMSQIYELLNSFANADAQNSDVRRANIELSKIRNSLPLNNNDKRKLVNKFKGISTPLEDISSIAAFSGENGGAVRENVSYMLYAIYCQKYKDDPRGYDMLMDYYNFLGYHGSFAKEMIRENGETYSNITDDQTAYLKMARGMIKQVFVTIPEISIDRLNSQADEMAKYDPYSIRRKKVQKAGAAGIMTLGGVFARRPDIVLQAGSTALAQIQLEGNDNAVDFLAKTFKDKGIDLNAFSSMLNQSKIISSTSQDMV